MNRLLFVLLAISLGVSACAPARLERLKEPQGVIQTEEADLSRAFDGASDPDAMYALGRWVEAAYREGAAGRPVRVANHLVHFHPGGPDTYAPGYFDTLEPVASYVAYGLVDHLILGVGVPMAGYRENKQRLPMEKWYPREGIARAVTAVATPGGQRGGLREVEIRLYKRTSTENVLAGDKRQRLAADFTVPWAMLLAKTHATEAYGLTTVVSEKAAVDPCFYLMEEYDPQRTPLILIHGMFSTQLAWAQLTNELWADPLIRQRYQIWHYLYPTNAPPLYSAWIMRGQLDKLRKALDPDQKDPAMRRAVVVSHSMGGLLAKSLVVEPRGAFWNAVFKKPMSEMNLTPAERAAMQEAFFWKPRPYVDRVIFCSVPFGGDTSAGFWLGKVGKHLMVPDRRFSEFYDEIAKKNPGAFQPPYDRLTGKQVNSLVDLDPKRRSLEVFRELPIIPGTATHVIKGSFDMVVSSKSSDLPGAESTMTVRSAHATFRNREAIVEIRRILALPPHH